MEVLGRAYPHCHGSVLGAEVTSSRADVSRVRTAQNVYLKLAFKQRRHEQLENGRIAVRINYENLLLCLREPVAQHDERIPLRVLREEHLSCLWRLDDEPSVPQRPTGDVEALAQEIHVKAVIAKRRDGRLRRQQPLFSGQSVVSDLNSRYEGSGSSRMGSGIRLAEDGVEHKACRLGRRQQLVRIGVGTKQTYQDAERIAGNFRSTHQQLFPLPGDLNFILPVLYLLVLPTAPFDESSRLSLGFVGFSRRP